MINKIKYKKYWRKSSLKQAGVGVFFLNEILKKKPKHFLEIGVFHGVTSRNVCDLLQQMHGKDFSFTGIDLFTTEKEETKDEIIPQTKFSNPLKTIYYKYIVFRGFENLILGIYSFFNDVSSFTNKSIPVSLKSFPCKEYNNSQTFLDVTP